LAADIPQQLLERSRLPGLADPAGEKAVSGELMAWIRTCASLIGFGFTIYQIFQYLVTKDQAREPFVSPQVLGVLMILVGLVALTLAWIQHRRELRVLKAEYGEMPYSIAGIMACFIAGLGLVALIGVTVRF
jgi:putative membrane protein